MKILDCESVDSTYESLEQILGIQRARLESLFDGLKSSGRPANISPLDYPLSEVQPIAALSGDYDQTCFFHLTRTTSSNRFENGLLPLSQIIESVWELLYGLVKDQLSQDKWTDFRKAFLASPSHEAWLYRWKMANRGDWGPFGFSIRDLAFSPRERQNHDYLYAPEIVVDICSVFGEQFAVDILALYRSITKPCIVKFSGPPQDDCVRAAVNYLYAARRNLPFGTDCVTGIHNEDGSPIPPDRILKIEFPEYP